MTHDAGAGHATVVAHPNIALVKYWGKRQGAGNLPAVGSLSVTLDTFASRTQVVLDGALAEDACTFAEAPAPAAMAARWRATLNDVRARARAHNLAVPFARVRSANNFPTGAGLASSASGFAALALAASRAYGLSLAPAELSNLARRGSGSAARSVFGGYVLLDRGERADGTDAVARPLLDREAWPLKVVVAITSRQQKAVGSTEGMERTRATSPFWPAWIAGQAADLAQARRAVEARDFAALAEVAEFSCLKMHALAQAARPGLIYFAEATLACLQAVRALQADGVPVFFTVDAGPQLKAVCLPQAAARVAQTLAAVPGVLQVHTLGLGPGAHVEAA